MYKVISLPYTDFTVRAHSIAGATNGNTDFFHCTVVLWRGPGYGSVLSPDRPYLPHMSAKGSVNAPLKSMTFELYSAQSLKK
jgi:hypothetical protein